MEAGGVGRLEEACECQLQTAMHPTYIAALNTRQQSVIGIRDALGTDTDPRIPTTELRILIRRIRNTVTNEKNAAKHKLSSSIIYPGIKAYYTLFIKIRCCRP